MADPRLLIHTLARLVTDTGSVAVGTNSPIPAAAILLSRAWAAQQGRRQTISILGSARHSPFTDGGRELFDFAAQGRLDAFFLGGGQIDGHGNINLLGIPDKVRFPGNFGAPYLYSLVPRVVLFREEHSPRVLVSQVDFTSASGRGPIGTIRPGGPSWLVTGRAVFRFDRERGRFLLSSIHPGEELKRVINDTGFPVEPDQDLAITKQPDQDSLDLINGPVAAELALTYPRFAASHFTI